MTNIVTTNMEGDVYFTPYKSYVAILNQTGTNNPVATVMNSGDSNFLGNIVWTRTGPGSYVATLANAFPFNKTFLSSQSTHSNTVINFINNEEGEPSSSLYLYIFDAIEDSVSDGKLYATSVEIRVYP